MGNIENQNYLSLKWTTKHTTDGANATATSRGHGSIIFVFVQRNGREWWWGFAARSILDKLLRDLVGVVFNAFGSNGLKIQIEGMQ